MTDPLNSDTQPRRSHFTLERPHPPTLSSPSLLRAYLPLALVAGIVALIGTAIIISAVSALARPVTVTVILDGEAFQYDTRAATVASLLDELGLSLGDNDLITPDLNTPIAMNALIRIDRARGIILTVDGRTRMLSTPLTNPAEILREAGVAIASLDRVIIDGVLADPMELERWPLPVMRLSVQHALPLHIIDGTERRTIQTTSDTVGSALFEAGIDIYVADAVSVELNQPVQANMEVVVQRALPVTIHVDGAMIETRSRGATVADALADAGVALLGLDYTVPAETVPLQAEMTIEVVRVTEAIIAVSEVIPYETVYQADETLELDQRAVLQAGQAGLRRTSTRIRYENGVEVARSEEGSTIVRAPVNHIIGYGTNVVIRTVDTPDGPREYWRVIRMLATRYHPAALGGDEITATGQRLRHGIVAADPGVMPFGTQVYVPNYGIGLVADTGGPRSTRLWIDLGYSDEDFRPWARRVDVYLLTPVPAHINYLLPN